VDLPDSGEVGIHSCKLRLPHPSHARQAAAPTKCPGQSDMRNARNAADADRTLGVESLR
jgi:hypothetical protein